MEKMATKDAEVILQKIFNRYTEPAFGSLTKKETDLMIFEAMCACGKINCEDDLYKIASTLKITRTKARNLVYETKLRLSNDKELDQELKRLLQSGLVYVADGQIGLEISNPFLADYIKFVLKEMKHLTDGSFSPELIRLSPNAYLDLCKEKAPAIAQKLEEIRKKEKKLENLEAINDFLTNIARDTKIPFAGSIVELVTTVIENKMKDSINEKKPQ